MIQVEHRDGDALVGLDHAIADADDTDVLAQRSSPAVLNGIPAYLDASERRRTAKV